MLHGDSTSTEASGAGRVPRYVSMKVGSFYRWLLTNSIILRGDRGRVRSVGFSFFCFLLILLKNKSQTISVGRKGPWEAVGKGSGEVCAVWCWWCGYTRLREPLEYLRL